MKGIRLITCYGLIMLCSCSKSELSSSIIEEVEVQGSYPNADERLWVYFRSFEIEAAKRGLDFNLRDLNIKGLVLDIPENGVAGFCSYGSHITNEVTIDLDFWNRAGDLSREFVVFHELGHCVLVRDHNEAMSSGGICLSIMRSGTRNCRDNYQNITRSAYLDELFSENNT